MKKSKSLKIVKKKRTYNNSSRKKKSTETEQKIIQTLVSLLVEREGADVQLAEIAARLKITERTIFRFFKDKKTLRQAMDSYLLSYLTAGSEKLQTTDFASFGKNIFKLFDENQKLSTAYVLSSFGNEARTRFRKKLTEAMIAQILKQRRIELTPKRAKRLAVIVSLVSAKIWYDIKTDFGYSGAEIGDSIEWALETLIASC